MKLRIISDLHIDPNWSLPFTLPTLDDDHETVLIVAGDAAEQLKAVPHMNDYCTRFHAVVYIMGNHEYYNGSILRTVAKIKAKVQHDNFHLLDAEEVVIGDTVVLGATLWTDFFNQDSFGMWNAKQAMNDYHVIRTGTTDDPYKRRLQPSDTLHLHFSHLEFIKMRVAHWKEADPSKKIVVVSHHAPSVLSVAPRFVGNALNCNFHSNLDEYIMDQPIALWVHGHMHNRSDYMIGDCRVVCNARGYQTKREGEWTEFDPLFTIEV